MWACDIIPWVSGGTIAFITGVYDELIDSLSSFNLKTIKLFFTGKRKSFRKEIHGTFLLLLFGGIFTAILTLVKAIDFLLTTYPENVWALFFGLILASAFLLKKTIKKWTNIYIFRLVVWLLVGYGITALPILSMWEWIVSTFLSGVFAIIAMILPGISGSYILVILWQYQHILSSIVQLIEWNLSALITIATFIVGAIFWIISFSKILHYIKARRHDQMMLVLIGLMLGSLNKVRPWKETLETFIDRHGDIQPLTQQNIIPTDITQAIRGLSLCLLWILTVVGVYFLAEKFNKKRK